MPLGNRTTENFGSGDERNKKIVERDNRVFYSVNRVDNALDVQVTEADIALNTQKAPVEIIRHTKIYDDIHEHPLTEDYSAEKQQPDAREQDNSRLGDK